MTNPVDLHFWQQRLLIRSRQRGMHETDLILSRFAQQYLTSFSAQQLLWYEELLALPDPVLYAWLSGQIVPPPDCHHEVLQLLLDFTASWSQHCRSDDEAS